MLATYGSLVASNAPISTCLLWHREDALRSKELSCRSYQGERVLPGLVCMTVLAGSLTMIENRTGLYQGYSEGCHSAGKHVNSVVKQFYCRPHSAIRKALPRYSRTLRLPGRWVVPVNHPTLAGYLNGWASCVIPPVPSRNHTHFDPPTPNKLIIGAGYAWVA